MVKTVSLDNVMEMGLSFVGKALFQSRGIIHQRSCAYTPQQNEIVERKHKQNGKASGLLFQSVAPLKY